MLGFENIMGLVPILLSQGFPLVIFVDLCVDVEVPSEREVLFFTVACVLG